MLYPALRSFALAMCVWGASMPLITPAVANARDISIRFDQLEDHVMQHSPRARILEQELEQMRAVRDGELQWTNPEVSYEHEEIEDFREYQVTVNKRLTMPWIHARQRSGWSTRVAAAEFRTDQETLDLLAEMKTGYVRIELLDDYLAHLEQLENIVGEALQVAEAQHTEGELSSVEKRLVQLSALSIDASRRKAQQELTRFRARWRGEMGIPHGVTVDLATDVEFVPVLLEPAAEYVTRIGDRPGTQARVALERALGTQARAERPSLLPELELYAGYKHVDPDNSGLVAGVAASLPLFNWGGATTRQLEAHRRIAQSELALHLSQTTAEVEALATLIEEMQPSLAAFADGFDDESPAISSLLYSYREGWLPLDGFLGGIRIEVDGLDDYYEQLITYFENIFRLEAITGAEIISFD